MGTREISRKAQHSTYPQRHCNFPCFLRISHSPAPTRNFLMWQRQFFKIRETNEYFHLQLRLPPRQLLRDLPYVLPLFHDRYHSRIWSISAIAQYTDILGNSFTSPARSAPRPPSTAPRLSSCLGRPSTPVSPFPVSPSSMPRRSSSTLSTPRAP